jgi:hypothetical protein
MKMLKQFIVFSMLALLVATAQATLIRVSPTSCSGTITTGNSAQTQIAASSGRIGFAIRNVSDGSLWISNKGTATKDHNSLEIKTGELYESPEHGTPVGAISVIGATTGQAFFCEVW